MFKETLEKIQSNKHTAGIIGLGYVGLPLGYAIAKKGTTTIGFDISEKTVEKLNNGKSHLKTVPHERVEEIVQSGCFEATTDFARIAEADCIAICVPTPLSKNLEPDLSYVESATRAIQPYLRKGHIIILESTTYPGTTEELIGNILNEGPLNVNEDFYIAYSPEREDPGNPSFETSTIPKVVGANNEEAQQLTVAFYQHFIDSVVPVSSASCAEAVKLTENIFRSINIALVNELKIIYSKMGIDVWEVIKAANTKPFGFMAFYPGPGLGGHCIPIDPFYLTWKAKEYGLSTRFIEIAGQINRAMPEYVVRNIKRELDLGFAKAMNGSKILVCGVAYKNDVDDIRESPSLEIIDLLLERKATVEYYDPHVSILPEGSLKGQACAEFTESNLQSYDVAVICTNHKEVDYQFLADNLPLIVDTRNVYNDLECGKAIIVKS